MKPIALMLRFALVLAVFAILAGVSTAQKAPRQEKLLNGLKILMWPDPTASDVKVRIRVHSGSAFDPQGKEGVMYLLARNFFPTQAARDFFAEDLGGKVDVVSNYDYIQINAESNPESLVPMLDTLAQVVSNPTIDKETTDKLKADLLLELDRLEKDPSYVADQAVAKRLFGKFPYGRPEMGTSDSLAKIDFAELVYAKNRFFGADNATVTISGKFDPDLAYRAMRRYLGAWLKSDKRVPSTFEQPGVAPIALQIVPTPVAGISEIRFAGIGYARKDADHAAANVLAAILQARLRAKVPEEYRSKVFVANNAHVLPGSFVFGIRDVKDDSSDPGSINVGDLIAKALAAPITQAEVVRIAQPDLETQWLDVDTYGLPPIKANQPRPVVTLAEVQRVADEYNKRPMVSVIVTKANAN